MGEPPADEEESNSDAASEAADEEAADPVEATAVPVHHSKPSKPTPTHAGPATDDEAEADEADKEAKPEEHHSKPTPPSKAFHATRKHPVKHDPTAPSDPTAMEVATDLDTKPSEDEVEELRRQARAARQPKAVLKKMPDGTYIPEDLEDDAALMEVEDQM